MQLVMIDKLKKYYSDKLVLDIDKFEILENEKIGLVGSNGAGKTTLIKALTRQIEIDEGQIYLTNSYSYITQSEDLDFLLEDNKIKSMLKAPDKFADYLSGGEKVKLRIANAFKEEKKLIIADEPTANLDKESINILESMLKKYNGAMLLVSHDRNFLDVLCNRIVEIDNGKLSVYNGNYTSYTHLKSKEREREKFEFEQYISEKKRLESAKIKKINSRDNIKKAPKRMGNSEARLHKMGDQRGKKNLDGNVKSIQSRIDKLEVKEKPKDIAEIKICIKDGLEIVSKNLIEVNNFTLLAQRKKLLDNVSFKIKRNKKIALLGENGCGKTTLIKEILRNNNSSIRTNPKVKIGYFDQSQEILKEDKSILDNIKVSSSFNETFIRINLNLFGFKGTDVHKKVNLLSGGEKVKVALCKIILDDNNFLVLDEPTNYLDITSLQALEEALRNTEKTMLIVSHDRAFIEKVCDYVIEIKNLKIKEFNGSYREYMESKNNKKLTLACNKKNEEILILENKQSQLISMLCLETNADKKVEYEKEYYDVLAKLKELRE
ncbi:macrolide transport system ATP-binding/permease protein [Clostridium collagenovorans DSM 3089]|uniref:Macrolide transport system ATP-binding/permease protein n=1 Tax=Clostridium collagenovorans DSM 3089 TaxID=1121306 RepID=A0A1M5Y585_9CLOT|nr:ABC-F type ribosomal protection protein CplR [Clostridium collagenovorans]SHI07207.1 macrolide transport system ATP-binding/permease protein [Clostridium collagenovorans DSM 3089]